MSIEEGTVPYQPPPPPAPQQPAAPASIAEGTAPVGVVRAPNPFARALGWYVAIVVILAVIVMVYFAETFKFAPLGFGPGSGETCSTAADCPVVTCDMSGLTGQECSGGQCYTSADC